mmetsp:Transcript_29716/g.50578  ORF Transcript_29716/g.50578 Transcript_29716/m.50578 type:complete len:278 (+) Transcript_29716:60-893(+)
MPLRIVAILQGAHLVSAASSESVASPTDEYIAAPSSVRRRSQLRRKFHRTQRKQDQRRRVKGNEVYDPYLGLADRKLQDMCVFCPGGLTVGPDTGHPVIEGGLDSTTCGEALAFAPTIEGDSALCLLVQRVEEFCCPEFPETTTEATMPVTTTPAFFDDDDEQATIEPESPPDEPATAEPDSPPNDGNGDPASKSGKATFYSALVENGSPPKKAKVAKNELSMQVSSKSSKSKTYKDKAIDAKAKKVTSAKSAKSKQGKEKSTKSAKVLAKTEDGGI